MTEPSRPPAGDDLMKPSLRGGWLSLAAATAMIAVVWTALLPALAEQPRVRERIDFLDSRGVDPSAMFYSDLKALDRVLDRLDHHRRHHAGELWTPVR
jgi:hypothetical protein